MSRGRRSRTHPDNWDVSNRRDKKELLELEMNYPTQKKVAKVSTFVSLHKYNYAAQEADCGPQEIPRRNGLGGEAK